VAWAVRQAQIRLTLSVPSIDPAVMRRLVAESRVARMATIDPDGRPHLVPLVFAVDGDVLYSSIDDKPKRTPRVRRLGNIRANPDRVTVLVDHYE
jgi:PPOX class probable F420-dependent enzyme